MKKALKMEIESVVIPKNIKDCIYSVRGLQVMVDEELAQMYGVETKYLNRAVKRNISRFPKKFRFQLTEKESESLRFQIGTLEKVQKLKSQIGTSSENSLRLQTATLEKGRGKHRKYLPYVFTEQGVSMLSAVLNSQYEPIEISILKTSHDRFLIIDDKKLYHFGASLKDLGKKWFAFSKLEMDAKEIIDKL